MESDAPNLLERALLHIRNAIQLLDEADAPPEIASHLDLARNMLEGLLTGRLNSNNPSDPDFG